MLVYDIILQESNLTHTDAIEWARGIDFSEIEAIENNPKYCDYIETVQGVDIYYNYAADYYFFAVEN